MLWYSKHVREMINHIKILIMTWKTFQLQKKAVCLNDALIRYFKATYYAKRDSKTTIFTIIQKSVQISTILRVTIKVTLTMYAYPCLQIY